MTAEVDWELDCPACETEGEVDCPRCEGEARWPCKCADSPKAHTHPCQVCAESGKLKCPACKGEGTLGGVAQITLSDAAKEALEDAGFDVEATGEVVEAIALKVE